MAITRRNGVKPDSDAKPRRFMDRLLEIGMFFQKREHVPAYSKYFIDEVNVIDAAANELVNFFEDCSY